jgi:hypothetical protein
MRTARVLLMTGPLPLTSEQERLVHDAKLRLRAGDELLAEALMCGSLGLLDAAVGAAQHLRRARQLLDAAF